MGAAIAVLNAGSSSIKFSLFAQSGDDLVLKLRGQVEGIHTRPRFTAKDAAGETVSTHDWGEGTAIGHAAVSDVHGNFIINRGQATGSDVIALVRRVRDEVRSRRHIELEPEVLLYGHSWKDFL